MATIWVSPTNFVDGASTWNTETLAYDGDTATPAYAVVLRDTWTNYLELTHAITYCDRVQLWSNITTGDTFLIEVDVYYGAGWNNIYSGTLTVAQWVEYPIGSTKDVTSLRVRYKYSNGYAAGQARLYEADFGSYDVATPVAKCYIAFTTNLLAATPNWEDVTSDLQNVSIKRGKQYEMGRIETGEATIQLKNISGNYWMNWTIGSHYPNVRPVILAKLEVRWNAVTYSLFYGYIESWKPEFLEKPIQIPVMTLTCVDMTKCLSRFLITSGGYSKETSGVRIDNILDDYLWQAALRTPIPFTGQYEMKVTGALIDANTLEHIYTVEDTENGFFFIAPNGKATFQDSSYRALQTSSATFGNGVGDNKFTDIDLIDDDKYQYNEARVTNEGGAEQTYYDSTTQTRDGKRILQKTGLFYTADDYAYLRAFSLVQQYKNPFLRARSITITGNADPTNLYPKIFSYDISTRITINLTTAYLIRDYYIEGVALDWDSQTEIWNAQWQLSDIYWSLNAGLGTETLRPDAAGELTEISTVEPAGGEHWEKVDEVTPDDADYVYETRATQTSTDLYNLPATAITTQIARITVYARMRWLVSSGASGNLTIKTGGTVYSSGGGTLTGSFVDYSYVWSLNPKTGLDWTVADINALQIGILLTTDGGGGYSACSQVYVEIKYSTY